MGNPVPGKFKAGLQVHEPTHHRGPRRKVDYATVIKGWNAGMPKAQLAGRHQISVPMVDHILKWARRAAVAVRHGTREEPPAPFVCEPCSRPIPVALQVCQPLLNDPAVFCRYCARRWDGGLYLTAAVRAVLEQSSDLRSLCTHDPVDRARLARERAGLVEPSDENPDDDDVASDVQ